MLRKLIKKFRKPLTLAYVNHYLRSKGVATNERGENSLSFKLYDMNWELYLESDRLGIRNSFTLGEDVEYSCLLQAANKLNNERWIIKAFLDMYEPVEHKEEVKEDIISSIVFSFEGFCYSANDFISLYEFAVYAIMDAIEFHRKSYNEFLHAKAYDTPHIGFRTNNESEHQNIGVKNENRNKIGFF